MKLTIRRRIDMLGGVSGGLGVAALTHVVFEGWSVRCWVCFALGVINAIVLLAHVERERSAT